MEEKFVNKWLRRRFTVIGWALVAYYLIMYVMALVTMFCDVAIRQLEIIASRDFSRMVDADAVNSNAWGYLAAIAIGLVVLYAWKGSEFYRVDIRGKNRPMTAGVFFCVLCLCMGSQMANSLWITTLESVLNLFGLSALGILENVSGQSDSFSMFLYSALAAPIAEEIFFRGFVLRSLQPFGKRFAILGSALLFGLFHGNLLQTPYAFLIGLVLGYVTVEYSMFWAVALHLFNNLVLADLLSRALVLLPELAASLLNLLIFGSFGIASIVILVVRRGEIKAYNHSEWIDRRCLKCFFTNSGVLVLTGMMVISMIMMLFV